MLSLRQPVARPAAVQPRRGSSRPLVARTRCHAAPPRQQQPAQEQQQTAARPRVTLYDPVARPPGAVPNALPDEMSIWDDDGAHFSSHRSAAFAYQPPSSDLPGVLIALGLVAAWAAVFKHGVFDYQLLGGPATLGHALDGLLTFASLEFLSTGLFITTHDSMHGAVAPNSRALNDVIGSVAVSLYAWFGYPEMFKAHWAHHNNCGEQGEDPDFHKGDPALLPWFASFMAGYVSWPQVAKLQAAVLVLTYLGAPLPNLLLFWAGSGLLSALRLFYFGTWLPHRPRSGADETMAWVKARSARAPTLLSALRCYCFEMHYEHHRWPNAPWWDLPRARAIRRSAIGSIDATDG